MLFSGRFAGGGARICGLVTRGVASTAPEGSALRNPAPRPEADAGYYSLTAFPHLLYIGMIIAVAESQLDLVNFKSVSQLDLDSSKSCSFCIF